MSSLWGCRWGDHREARAVVGSAPDWDALQRGISGQLVRPGDDAYQRARTPFIAWFDDPEPQAVVRCAAPEDVAEVIGFARRQGIGIAARSGGHCFAGYSSTRGVVIDVTPMSSVVDADEQHHAELFWALRGAGAGNFGVVTSFTFQLRPAAGMSNFHLAWSYGQAAAVIAAWQRWAPQGPDELAAELVLTGPGDPSAEPTVELYGTALGTLGDAGELLERLIPLVGADPRSQV